MNKIEDKTKYRLLITILLLIISGLIFGLLIFAKINLGGKWRLVLSSFLGIILGGFAFYLRKWKLTDWKNPLNIFLTFVSIILWFIPFRVFTDKFGVDTLFDIPMKIDLEQSLKDEKEAEFNVIFIFDKTAYAKTDIFTNQPNASTLRAAYECYFADVQKIYSDVKKGKTDSYRDFCRIRLCADLLSLKDTKGTFSIYTIDDDFVPLPVSTKQQQPFLLTESYIRAAIIELNSMTYIDNNTTTTDFNKVYRTLCTLIPNKLHINNFPKYSLYVYSDFIHDKTYQSENEAYIDLQSIIKYQENLDTQDVVQQNFVIPHTINSKQQNYILEEKSSRPQYKNTYKLESYQFNLEEYNERNLRVKYLPDILLYKDPNGICSPDLYFPLDKKYTIRLENKNSLKEGQQLFLSMNGKEIGLDTIPIPITSGKVFFKFIGQKPTNESQIFLDIAQAGGIHGFDRLDFQDPFIKLLKYLLPLFFWGSGFWITIFVLSCLKNKKSLKTS